MHLAVNAVGIKHGGGATVLLEFLAAALKDHRVDRVTLFCSPPAERRFNLPREDKLMERPQAKAEKSYLRRVLWSQLGLRRAAKGEGADILLCLVGVGLGDSRLPHVVMVQQTLPLVPAPFGRRSVRSRLRMAALRRLMGRSCREAAHVVVQTPTMRAVVAETFGIARERITDIIPLVSLPSCVNRPFGDRDSPRPPRLLYVGSQSPHKNLGLLVEGMRELRTRVPDAVLLATVPKDSAFAEEAGVQALGHLDRGELFAVYSAVDLLVMPSLVETVGLPMVEAMVAGTPVLAAALPYARDICEDAALFFDPRSPSDFATQAARVLQDPELARSMRRAGLEVQMRRAAMSGYTRLLDVLEATLACA